jgi:hypothetical protein
MINPCHNSPSNKTIPSTLGDFPLTTRTINRLVSLGQDALSAIEDDSEFVSAENQTKFDKLVSDLEHLASDAAEVKEEAESEADDESSDDEDEEEG